MLDAGIYEQLSRLVIAMKQKSSQNMAGNRRYVQKGTSAEFSDFREYMPGDDLRRLDWNVYPGIFRRKGSSGIGYSRYQCINALWKKEQGRTGTGSVRGDCLSDFAPYGPAGAV